MNLVSRAAGLTLVGSVVCLLAAAIGRSAVQADEQTGQVPVFKSRLDVVPLHVAVIGADARPVLNLQAADFVVHEDGRAVQMAAFTPPPQAIVVSLLIADHSVCLIIASPSGLRQNTSSN